MDRILMDPDLDTVTGGVSAEGCFTIRIDTVDLTVCLPKNPPPPPPPPPSH
jgi:hypothetical protein